MLYVAQGVARGRVRRTLIPGRADLAHLGRAIVDHARLRLPHGEEARRYNLLQKLSYLPVVFGLLPLMILTGLAMSPAIMPRTWSKPPNRRWPKPWTQLAQSLSSGSRRATTLAPWPCWRSSDHPSMHSLNQSWSMQTTPP
jgi:hypothetical protein